MKKSFKFFFIVWALAVLLFNAITFIVPNNVLGVTRFDKPIFWISYALVMVTFIGQIIVSLIYSRRDTAEKKFLGLTLLRESIIAVLISLIVGAVFMTLPILPTWIAAIVCLLVLAYHLFTAIKITAAINYVEYVGEKVKAQTELIRTLTTDASTLSAKAKTTETKAIANKVYETIRYSDPMSNDSLSKDDADIQIKYNELKDSIVNNKENIKELADELFILLKDRNAKCKALK